MTSLDGDRRRPEVGKILHPGWLENYRALRLLLQTINQDAIFMDDRGFSIFIFEAHRSNDPATPHFDFYIACPQIVSESFDWHSFVVSVVHNGVGFFCVPLDGGASEMMLGPLFARFHSIPLHRTQYLELLTRVQILEALRFNFMTYSLVERDGKHLIFPVSPPGPIYAEWNQDGYMTMLKYYWDSSRIAAPWAPGRLITSLCWPDGNPIVMDAAGRPMNAAGHWPMTGGSMVSSYTPTRSF